MSLKYSLSQLLICILRCSGIVSCSTENRNQTGHPNHLWPTSCPSSSSRSATCYSTSNQTIDPIIPPPVFLNPTSRNTENTSYKPASKPKTANLVCHKRSFSNAAKTLLTSIIGTSTQAPNCTSRSDTNDSFDGEGRARSDVVQVFFHFFFHSHNPKAQTLIAPFLFHYFNRTILYPLRLLKAQKAQSGFPLTIALMAFSFNLLNSYLQARSVSHYNDYSNDGLFWARFGLGLLVFLSGMGVNVWADRALLRLKSEGKGYVVPKGGLFEFVACPNYFGEILEWLGWALMTWSWAGLGFFLYTFANLGPRARANLRWYLDKFGEDYPRERKGVIPYLY